MSSRVFYDDCNAFINSGFYGLEDSLCLDNISTIHKGLLMQLPLTVTADIDDLSFVDISC